MGESVKGRVTSLSSVYAPEDAQKASIHVQQTISEYQLQVEKLQSFVNDNTNLINLVKKLPDQLNHDIMVPFGKAAFFPGKLIHTNELLVLLGEGYYADRTSKQTIEILKRRGKDLESQIENINAIIKDLKFEASFFNDTATEAAEGIVEIREDYVEEEQEPIEDEPTTAGEDDFARILARMNELEKEELESEFAEEGEEEVKDDLSQTMSSISIEPKEQPNSRHSINKISQQNETQQVVPKPLKPNDSPAFPVSKNSHVKISTSSGSSTPQRLAEHSKLKESLPLPTVSKNEVSTMTSNSSIDSSKAKEVSSFSSSSYDTSKAFTGSIVEHAHNLEKNKKSQTPAPASKPVSRFKLQRK